MPDLLLATANRHKTAEFSRLLPDNHHLLCLADLPDATPPEETGRTFAANAWIKALAASAHFPGTVIADDSGLEVDALDGEPGVRSARYAGDQADDAANRRRLLDALAARGPHKAERSARFVCVIAAARGGRRLGEFHGVIEGRIAPRESGDGGFGYDPLFIPECHDLTFAELPPKTKDALSHRGRAVASLLASGLLADSAH